ncbi:MAG TPA: AmmeMemoRadiSam system radical SAM enzyme [Bacillota bacterium]|jgi:pyruvate formate lyase activating enzyme
MHDAMFWQKGPEGRVDCVLCPVLCKIAPGKLGACRARKNVDGRLFSMNYGKVASHGLDPIEKKPLYHFYPGAYIFSLGTFGCNLHCSFCQNWEISQQEAPTAELEPAQAVATAERAAKDPDHFCIGLAYTYSEPFIWYEYVYDCARLAKDKGLKNVLVTNGYVNPEPLEKILPLIDAMNVDVKGFTERFYRRVCLGRREPVLHTVERAHAAGVHVEVTNLIIPTQNDDPAETAALVDWMAGVDPRIPLHFSRYFPQYKLDLPPTPGSTLKRAREIARKKLKHVYIGNIGGVEGSDTFCEACGEVIAQRDGMALTDFHLEEGRCQSCGTEAPFVGEVRRS